MKTSALVQNMLSEDEDKAESSKRVCGKTGDG
jgi:hypothetical protein